MKNLKNLFLIWVVVLCLFSFSFAGNLSQASKARVDNIMMIVENELNKETVFAQLSRYEKFVKAFSNVKSKNSEQNEMIKYLVECFQKKVDLLKNQLKTQEEVAPNVDWDKVQEEWLAWHNEERNDRWLDSYTYNESLNYTSLIRAQQIASEKRKTWSTHARMLTDWYRNTDSIKERFSNLWVKVVYFSESNAYGYYNCKKSDCTQEMIDVLKTCFNRTFMDGSHYPAVVSSTFDQIWLWVAINWNYVWVTTHYWKNIK